MSDTAAELPHNRLKVGQPSLRPFLEPSIGLGVRLVSDFGAGHFGNAEASVVEVVNAELAGGGVSLFAHRFCKCNAVT